MSLGPCFVPLHLNSVTVIEGASERDIASLKLQHWRDMINRSSGMKGFRLPHGTGSKRKKPRRGWGQHKDKIGPVEMYVGGLWLAARHGSKAPIHV